MDKRECVMRAIKAMSGRGKDAKGLASLLTEGLARHAEVDAVDVARDVLKNVECAMRELRAELRAIES